MGSTSMNVGALVTLVAAVHYFYMREFWVTLGSSPILYRYIDWSITVPLQMVEFYFILTAVKSSIGSMMFFRLFMGTVWRLASATPLWRSSADLPVGSTFCTRSSQAKLAKNPVPLVDTSRLALTP